MKTITLKKAIKCLRKCLAVRVNGETLNRPFIFEDDIFLVLEYIDYGGFKSYHEFTRIMNLQE